MSSIDGLINGLERENEDFENEVGTIEASLESQRLGQKQPLEKLERMLHEWDDEERYTQDDIVKFANELWTTTADFERELRDSAKGFEIELKMAREQHTRREEQLKKKTSV